MKHLGFELIFFSLTIATAVSQQYFARDRPCQRGTCTLIRDCREYDWFIQKDFITNDDYQFVMNSKCGWQGQQVKVCCNSQTQNVVTSKPSNKPITNRNSLLPVPGQSNCGLDASTDKITHGENTNIDEFPWMAVLQYDVGRGRLQPGCGGSLINERYVLTAAHCIRSSPRLSNVVLGEWDTSTSTDCQGTECTDDVVTVGIEQTIVHEQYNPNGQANHHDIALLRLNQPVQYSYFIKPICLPTTNQLKSHTTNPNGVSFIVAGWGRTETGRFSEVKKKASILGKTNDYCQQAYARTKSPKEIISSQICAGGDNEKDTCGGDSGGPLMQTYRQNGEHFLYLQGIVSYGPTQCGTPGFPGVYTKVTEYMDWIESKLRP